MIPNDLKTVLQNEPVNLIRYSESDDGVYVVPSHSGLKDFGGWHLTKDQWEVVRRKWPRLEYREV